MFGSGGNWEVYSLKFTRGVCHMYKDLSPDKKR